MTHFTCQSDLSSYRRPTATVLADSARSPPTKMLSPAQLAILVGLPLCDCFGGALFAVILHPFGFAAHPEPATTPSNVREPGTTPSNVRETRATSSPQQWIHTVGRNIMGHNTKRLTGVTIEECKKACSMPQAWPTGGCCFTSASRLTGL